MLDVVYNKASPAEVVNRIIGRSLIIFLSGGRHKTPSTLLAAPQLKTLLKALSDQVDIAIIDAPSVLPHADANLLVPNVDASMLVSLDNFSQSGILEKVIQQLGRDRVIGSIYNKVAPKTHKRLSKMRDIRMTAT